MKNPLLFIGSLIVAVIALGLGVFYLIAGPYHPLTFSKTPYSSHLTHAIVFFVLAILLVLVALVNRPKSSTR